MLLVDVVPNRGMPQHLAALPTQLHAVLVHVGGSVERLEKGLHLHGRFEKVLVETLDEAGQLFRHVR